MTRRVVRESENYLHFVLLYNSVRFSPTVCLWFLGLPLISILVILASCILTRETHPQLLSAFLSFLRLLTFLKGVRWNVGAKSLGVISRKLHANGLCVVGNLLSCDAPAFGCPRPLYYVHTSWLWSDGALNIYIYVPPI